VIVIGGGAAGLLAAIEAGKRGRSVLVLEHSNEVGRKIAISGGGRCNFTNLHTTPDSFLSANPDFCKSALARYTPQDFITLVEKHRINYHEKKMGQLFCDGSSREIIDMLRRECEQAGVEIRVGCVVNEVSKGLSFVVEASLGRFESDSLIIATGGLSIPKIGATDFGYRAARRFDLKTTGLKPGLVPLSFGEEDKRFFSELSGVSVDAAVSFSGQEFRENVLMTHRGVSGPAILQISSYWNGRDPIYLDLLPGLDALEIFMSHRESEMELPTLLSRYLPRRFAQGWCARVARPGPMNRFNVKELERVARELHGWPIRPTGTEGYGKAEVTVGGIDTGELSSKTMEARRVKGLYFIGEVVDVTGHLGGFNFQWAWASGYAAGQFA
jgi:predicted Rossmann fold flavoprotein